MHFAQFLYGDLFFGFLETEIPINLAKIGSKCNLFGFKIYYIIYIYIFFFRIEYILVVLVGKRRGGKLSSLT